MPPEPTSPDDKDKLTSPQSPAAPTPAPKKTGDAEIDAILLPQKEVRVVQSTQRINAGVLFEQEQSATLLTPKEPAQKAPATAAPKDESEVRPLQTYQGDIERLVQDKNVSVVSIAAAEAGRRDEAAQKKAAVPTPPPAPRKPWGGKLLLVLGGVILIAVAIGTIGYIALKLQPLNLVEEPQAPFISVDDTKAFVIDPKSSPQEIMSSLQSAKVGVKLSLGLVERLVPAISSTTADGQTLLPLDAQTFLSRIAPNIPPEFLRTIQPTYLVGVHIFDGNQAFLILSVDSYEQGYSGMLAWERTMQKELTPVFMNNPSPQISPNNLASSTPETFIKTDFFDKIIANHDTRVVQNSVGDILMFWTFLDRSTIVITTNESTLSEVIRRLEEAPITPTP